MTPDPHARLVSAAVVLAIALGAGYVEGRRTGRWSRSDALASAVKRLGRVPYVVGGWEGKDLPFNSRDMKRAGLEGGLMRSFRRKADGVTLSVLLVCGRPGPASVHTPDVCYRGAGYEPVADPVRVPRPYDPSGQSAAFFTADFRKQDTVTPEFLRILWAWSPGRVWTAPQNPRLSFASEPALYKLYVIRQVSGPSRGGEDDPVDDFLRLFLPELDRKLGPEAAVATRGRPVVE